MRSTTHAHVSMREAMSDASMGADFHPYVLKYKGNFELRSSDATGTHVGWNNEFAYMPTQYNSALSTTGTDSNDLSADFFEQLMKLLNTARDRNGVPLFTKLDLNKLGIHGWSGAGHILDGADDGGHRRP